MCEEGDHFHARENPRSSRMSNRQLSDILHRKFSTQSFQQIEYMMPRRASFFHPGALSTSTSNMHDAELLLATHHPTQQPQRKLPFYCSQKKFSAPNLKRASVSVPKPPVKTPAAAQGDALPTRCRLTESESYEGPNYFLSRFSPATSIYRNEYASHTLTGLPHEQHHHPSLTSSHYSQQQLQTKQSTLQPNGEQMNFSKSKDTASSQSPEADGMQRRQTLVNLENAKYRYLAAEMAHKRVLERSADAAGEGAKKHAKAKRKRGKTGKSATSKERELARRKSSSSSSENAPFSPPTSLTTSKNVEPSSPQSQRPAAASQPPVRGFEPSKVVPLLIARSMMSQADGGPLSAVPEEGGHELGFTPSPALVSSTSPSASVSTSNREVARTGTFHLKGEGDWSGSPKAAVSPTSTVMSVECISSASRVSSPSTSATNSSDEKSKISAPRKK